MSNPLNVTETIISAFLWDETLCISVFLCINWAWYTLIQKWFFNQKCTCFVENYFLNSLQPPTIWLLFHFAQHFFFFFFCREDLIVNPVHIAYPALKLKVPESIRLAERHIPELIASTYAIRNLSSDGMQFPRRLTEVLSRWLSAHFKSSSSFAIITIVI